MRFETVDRVPFCEFIGFWPETIYRWHREGLPTSVGVHSYSLPIGLGNPQTVYDYFGFDPVGGPYRAESCVGDVAVDFAPIPRFIQRTLVEDARYRLEVDESGITKRVLKVGVSMPGFVGFPVKEKADWEKVKQRFNPNDPRRLPKNWGDEAVEYYRVVDHPVGIGFPGFFGQPRNLMGVERLLVAFYRDRRLLEDILDFWADFVIETSRGVVEAVRLDYVNIWEDMSYRTGPLISPSLFEEFLLPRYRKVTRYLREKGVETIMVDTDGNHDALTPLFLEAGVNCIYPLEAQAGIDARALRRTYGRELRLVGNIDKTALTKGRDAIEQEIEAKLPLAREGGYIPSVDHAVPSDVPFENYRYYVQLLRERLEQM
ncbi:MAG: uroporphyrinogen decarboxylase family protein [Candidatus Bathyarchaeia archaeon]